MLPPYSVQYYNAEPGDKLDGVIDVPHGGKAKPFFDYYPDFAHALGDRRGDVERLCELEADTFAPDIGHAMGEILADSGRAVVVIETHIPREWVDMDRHPNLAPAFLYDFNRHPGIFNLTMDWYDEIQARRRAFWRDLKPTGRLVANHTMRSWDEPESRIRERNRKLTTLFGPNFDFTTFNWNQFRWDKVDWKAVDWKAVDWNDSGVGGWIMDRIDLLTHPGPETTQRKCGVVARKKMHASETGTLNVERFLFEALIHHLNEAEVEYDLDGAYFYSPRMLPELVAALGKWGVLFETRKELMAVNPKAPLDELVINPAAVQKRASILAEAILASNTRATAALTSGSMLAVV